MQWLTLAGPEGHKIPSIGLGTFKAIDDDVYNAVLTALDVGYRHFDTAFLYGNERQIGRAISKWISQDEGTRENLFITTKLPHFGNRAEDVEKFLTMSLEKLQTPYIDLYLIHMPFAFRLNESGTGPLKEQDDVTMVIDHNNDNIATWKVMEQQVKKGLVKSIGLSNFNISQVQKIYNSAEIKPAVLQVEMHAYLQQDELIEACKRMNIAVTAYAPLGSPAAAQHFTAKYRYNNFKILPSLITNPLVVELAKKYNKTSGQILLRHLLEKNIIVIPKSSNPKRIEDNFKIFDFNLANDDIKKLNDLDRKEGGRTFDFRFYKGIENHPEYPFSRV
ncbi:aldo/keto reductase [Holotrichia oblita]|uniref:Aldo/keto reductase n=1 Tax=Holotrichia oblita TaxID=644536 RepID=A0ACB9TQJ6_HOLOL|nr:aldo/keto reductase [Holotrichia oblita]